MNVEAISTPRSLNHANSIIKGDSIKIEGLEDLKIEEQ